jgi:hypothetical protein
VSGSSAQNGDVGASPRRTAMLVRAEGHARAPDRGRGLRPFRRAKVVCHSKVRSHARRLPPAEPRPCRPRRGRTHRTATRRTPRPASAFASAAFAFAPAYTLASGPPQLRDVSREVLSTRENPFVCLGIFRRAEPVRSTGKKRRELRVRIVRAERRRWRAAPRRAAVLVRRSRPLLPSSRPPAPPLSPALLPRSRPLPPAPPLLPHSRNRGATVGHPRTQALSSAEQLAIAQSTHAWPEGAKLAQVSSHAARQGLPEPHLQFQ